MWPAPRGRHRLCSVLLEDLKAELGDPCRFLAFQVLARSGPLKNQQGQVARSAASD